VRFVTSAPAGAFALLSRPVEMLPPADRGIWEDATSGPRFNLFAVRRSEETQRSQLSYEPSLSEVTPRTP
jgi:hypothetical protein